MLFFGHKIYHIHRKTNDFLQKNDDFSLKMVDFWLFFHAKNL